jgi:CheY-like chemotaxis protein
MSLSKPTPVAVLPAAPLGRRVRKRVLVVDDNPDAADLLGDVLIRAGYEVSVVNDPLEALSNVSDFKPDVAVLDIGLPVMDGYELATRLRASSACLLIALTGYGRADDVTRSQGAGFDSHLVKPVDTKKLLEIVASAETIVDPA